MNFMPNKYFSLDHKSCKNFSALTFNQYYIYVKLSPSSGGQTLSPRPAVNFLCGFLLASPLSLYPELEWLQHEKYFFKVPFFKVCLESLSQWEYLHLLVYFSLSTVMQLGKKKLSSQKYQTPH